MKATLTLRYFLFIIALSLLSVLSVQAQQYQFASNGRDGRDTVTTTRIVNSYAKVKAITGNTVYTNGPYVPQVRDRVLLVQMTGRDSGVWQWDTVRIGGNPCYLSNIYKSFDTANGAKIQIIKAPQYQSLYVRSTGVLTAAPWNDSTGGVLTFMVKDTFKMDAGGNCNVSYLGFLPQADTSSAGAHGAGGAGGLGGAIGQNGGDSALVVGSGVGGGGDGGMFGQYGTAGNSILYAFCPGCATPVYVDTAKNLSLIDSGLAKNKFMMGGAGRTGHGGKGGRGGGGGGGGTAGPGTNGGAGGAGGRGGTGGRGGGVILFSSGYMKIPDSTLLFFAIGENGRNGMPGDTGQAGGNGGPGLGPCTVGPGGGGRGASGGNGGDGGGGGGGGVVYGVLFHAAPSFTDRSYTTAGGMRGRGGIGGPGGPGGQSGSVPGGTNCGGIQAGQGPNGDNGSDGNNGNNGVGSGGSSGGGGGVVVQPCQNFNNYQEAISVGYGCTTQGYLTYFENNTGAQSPFTIFGEDTFSGNNYTTYLLTVGNASGCVAIRGGNVSQTVLQPSYEVTPACPGTTDGQIVVTLDLAPPGPAPCVPTAGYTAIYDINGFFIDSTQALALWPGRYYVVWGINNELPHYDTIELATVTPVTITPTITDPTCSQPDGGSIHLQVAGEDGCLYYYYSWNNQASGYNNDNLAAGTYEVSITYNGPDYCIPLANVWYNVNYACAQTETYTVNAPVGSEDVYLDVDVCPGIPYNYNGIDYYAGTNIILPANPGGCDTTIWLTVNEYYSPQGYEYQQICDGDQYFWNGNYYNQTGQYYTTLFGADALGCDSTVELDLYVAPPITAGNLNNQTIGDGCSTEPDYLAMNITGGDGSYSYSSYAGTESCLVNALATPYTIDVADGNGCTAEFSLYVLYQQDSYAVSIDNTSPEACLNAADGTVSYTLQNLDNVQCNNPYVYFEYNGPNGYYQSISIPTYQTVVNTDYNLPAGIYYYNVSGIGACVANVHGTFVIGAGSNGVTGGEYDTICDGASFYWPADGNTYTQSGTYTVLITGGSSTGCDSTAHLYLTVLPPITAGNVADQTFGDGCSSEPDYNAMNVSGGASPYQFYPFVVGSPSCTGNALTTSYLVEVDDAAGCIGNFYVDVNYVQDSYSVSIDNTTPETCLGVGNGSFTYTIANLDNQSCHPPTWSLQITGSNSGSQAGIASSSSNQTSTEYGYGADTYNYTLTGLGSCIAPINGSFTINLSLAGTTGTEYQTICDNRSITWNGNTYTQAGVYPHLFAGGSSIGCDSTAYLHLTVKPTYTRDWYDTIYSGQSATLDGVQYSIDGTYTATLSSAGGCDSTVTLYLTVLQSVAPVTTYLTEQICAGSDYTVGSHSYTTPGSYTDTLSSLAGGDSIIYLTLTVINPVSSTATASICAGGSYSWAGNSYTQAGTYTNTFTAASGCDSLVTLTLNVTQPVTGTAMASICAGGSYSWGGNSYTLAGNYTHTFTAVSGCDSIVTLTLNVTQPVTVTATASICAGGSYTWAGNSYAQAGTYTHTFTAASGCDSVVTLTLNVTQPVSGTATASICAGGSYSWAGNSYAQAGTYTHTFTAASGCDSVVTLTLNVTQPVSGTATASICAGGSYSWAGNSYTQAGTYTHTFTTTSGCDSIVTLFLSVTQPVSATIWDTICQGESYAVGSHTYTTSGTYTDVLVSAAGCDSVQNLNLIVLQSVTPSLIISVAHGPIVNGQQVDTFRASYTACDGAFYSWYLNLQPVGIHDSLAVIAHFINQADSIVCRIDCQNHCASTVYTYSNRIRSGLTDAASFLHAVKVYPNPNAGAFTLELTSDITTTAHLNLLDVIGQEVLTDQMDLRAGDNMHQIQLPESAASGVYILQMTVAGHTLYERITTER